MKTTNFISNPHDKGYKHDLSLPSEFLHFLKKYVGADWTKDLEVSQLRLADKEFITKDYEGRESDLIYEISLKNSHKIYVFILQELQSCVDFTMIFRILIYIFNILMRFFLSTDSNIRTQKNFKLPAVIPIVFYNGNDSWTAVQELRDYQMEGSIFGDYVLNLKYYLVDLNQIDEEYILNTNTVIDNIMYCDKFRKKAALAKAVRTAFERVDSLGKQEKEEFSNWVKNILLAVCGNNKFVVEEILTWALNGDGDVTFKYNIVRMFETEREYGKIEGQTIKLLSQIRKKMQKNLSPEEIADILEEDTSLVNEFYTLLKQNPEMNDDEIYNYFIKQPEEI